MGAEVGARPDALLLYSLLDLCFEATPEDVRAAYLRQARRWHPDRHRTDEATMRDANRRFQQIVGAYEVLNDPERRRAYDMGFTQVLDVEEYLKRFQDLTLTACGLGMMSRCSFFTAQWPAAQPETPFCPEPHQQQQSQSLQQQQQQQQAWSALAAEGEEEEGEREGEQDASAAVPAPAAPSRLAHCMSMFGPRPASFPGAGPRWGDLLTC